MGSLAGIEGEGFFGVMMCAVCLGQRGFPGYSRSRFRIGVAVAVNDPLSQPGQGEP